MTDQEASSGYSVNQSYRMADKRKRSVLADAAQSEHLSDEETELLHPATLNMTPENIVWQRRTKNPLPIAMEPCTRSEEEKEKVHMYVAKYFYECGVPLDAIRARSFEVMAEAIGQFGPGYEPPRLLALII